MPTKSGMEPGADEEKLDAQLAPYQIFKTVVHGKFSPFALNKFFSSKKAHLIIV
jgi:hypothetical protein